MCALHGEDFALRIIFPTQVRRRNQTYGDLTDGKTDLVDLAVANMKDLGPALSGYAVDFVPWCEWIFPSHSRDPTASSTKLPLTRCSLVTFHSEVPPGLAPRHSVQT